MKWIFRLLAAVIWAATACPATGEALSSKRILVVHSYHETQKGHVVEMTQGIEQAFMGSGAAIHYFHMDTKRRPDPEWKKESGQLAMAAMQQHQPDVVIAMDDNAQAYFVKLAMVRDHAPDFVFGGVNADPSVYGFPRVNVTGVLERPNITESLDLLLKIQPQVKSIVMLSDQSRTTDLFVAYAKTLQLPVAVKGYIQVRTQKEWEAAIDLYKDRVDAFGIYLLRTIRREAGDMAGEDELMAILNRKTRLPTVGFFDTAAEAGVLCGISVSMMEQGYAAGRMAREILTGRPPAFFKIEPTRRGRIQLNLKQAERLGLQLDWDIISKADVVIR